jgi:hypothetical protein
MQGTTDWLKNKVDLPWNIWSITSHLTQTENLKSIEQLFSVLDAHVRAGILQSMLLLKDKDVKKLQPELMNVDE